jgi:hypothetical protein
MMLPLLSSADRVYRERGAFTRRLSWRMELLSTPAVCAIVRGVRRSLLRPLSCATEITTQSQYPGGILIPKIGAASSLAYPTEINCVGYVVGVLS